MTEEKTDNIVSGLQKSAIRALPFQYLRLTIYKALEGMSIEDALDFAYDEWINREEVLENAIKGKP